MKVSLVVAQGVHSGKVIPIASAQFLIGRDANCNLRPASPAISKQHCGIFIREGRVFLQDYGSTNGTSVNGEAITGEREVANEDKLKIGPLEFVLKIEATDPRATVKAAPAKKTTTAPAAGPTPPPKQEPAVAVAEPLTSAEEQDQAAAMFLAMDDTGAADPTTEAKIPDGTTVMEIPSVAGAAPPAGQHEKAKQEKADTSKAASDLLSKYMRRPRT